MPQLHNLCVIVLSGEKLLPETVPVFVDSVFSVVVSMLLPIVLLSQQFVLPFPLLLLPTVNVPVTSVLQPLLLRQLVQLVEAIPSKITDFFIKKTNLVVPTGSKTDSVPAPSTPPPRRDPTVDQCVVFANIFPEPKTENRSDRICTDEQKKLRPDQPK